jgi:hypothetical protein
VNTPQQQVVVDNGDISIQPADPNAIYVPQYDPDDVYDEGYSPDMGPLITFGPAWPVGEWLNYAFDWHRRGFYRGDWRRGGRGGFVGRDAGVTNASPWSPDPNRVRRAARTSQSAFRSVIRPKPLPGVTIPHGNRTGGNARTGTSPNAISGPGSPSNPTQRDFRGRGVNPPTGPAVQNKPLSPALVPHPPAPPPSILNDYRRGSDARAASNRGLTGRQPNVAPAIKPAPPAPNPAAPAPRPAPPAPRPAPPAPKPAPPAPKPAPPAPKPAPPAPRPAPPAPRPAPPAPRPAPPAPRPAPPAPRPAPPAPPPSAFHVAPAAAANAASARGAQSRDKRLPNQ